MWDLIVSVPDHCLSFYFEEITQGMGMTESAHEQQLVMFTSKFSSSMTFINLTSAFSFFIFIFQKNTWTHCYTVSSMYTSWKYANRVMEQSVSFLRRWNYSQRCARKVYFYHFSFLSLYIIWRWCHLVYSYL